MTSQQPIDSLCFLRISGQYILIDYAWRFVVLKLSCGNDGAVLEFDLKAHMHLNTSMSQTSISHNSMSRTSTSHTSMSQTQGVQSCRIPSSLESILHVFLCLALCCCYQ